MVTKKSIYFSFNFSIFPIVITYRAFFSRISTSSLKYMSVQIGKKNEKVNDHYSEMAKQHCVQYQFE